MQQKNTSWHFAGRSVLRKGFRRVRSRQSWVVLYRPLVAETRCSPAEGISFAEAGEGQLDQVAYALPDELVGGMSDAQRLGLVRARFRVSTPCVLAQESSSGHVMAGCWCRPVGSGSKLRVLLPEGSDVFEISSLFTAPEYRGQKLGKVVIHQACHVMAQKGYTGCVSLVWYTRLPSIKAHLSSGFQPVGEKITWSVLGFRWSLVRRVSTDILKAKLARAGV